MCFGGMGMTSGTIPKNFMRRATSFDKGGKVLLNVWAGGGSVGLLSVAEMMHNCGIITFKNK